MTNLKSATSPKCQKVAEERELLAFASQVAAYAAVAVAWVDRGRGEQEAARGEQQEVARVVGAIVVVVDVGVGSRGGGQGMRHFDLCQSWDRMEEL